MVYGQAAKTPEQKRTAWSRDMTESAPSRRGQAGKGTGCKETRAGEDRLVKGQDAKGPEQKRTGW